MKKQLFKAALSTARKYAEPNTRVLVVESRMLEDAKRITDACERDMPSASAEAKHARAYAKLGSMYGKTPRRQVSLAIELVLNDVG